MASPFTPRRRVAACLIASACAFGAAGVAQAAPEASDPVLRLLQEKGLVDATTSATPPAATAMPAPAAATATGTAAPGFMQQVRDKASDMVLASMEFLGVPYRRGGDSAEDGFDCSGFTRHVFEKSLGLVLPRRAADQAQAKDLLQVAREELKPGDLVFFNTMKRAFSHVGIYVGDNKFIHAPRTGGAVRVEDMRIAYWTQRYNGARRAAGVTAETDAPQKSAAAAGTAR